MVKGCSAAPIDGRAPAIDDAWLMDMRIGCVLAICAAGVLSACSITRPLDEYDEGPASPASDGGTDSSVVGDVSEASTDVVSEQAGCPSGFADCDQDPSNGCETDLQTSASHCGECQARCESDVWDVGCVQGACRVLSCPTGLDDCNGSVTDWCETSILMSAAHCGGCNKPCPDGFSCINGLCSCDSQKSCDHGGGGSCMPASTGRLCRCDQTVCDPGEVCLDGEVCGAP
ncbi:MAG: hypothetical protein CVU63_06450 [Deltaproteobacteria bacterium HGW-Deltaproteobacteria-20]|jgi:hypothetical protein|nr:MAG: hypothetical protein CVU63_06450 [Deltaproteobacteria bacterium HGW-Deltaproteobacteria-20]